MALTAEGSQLIVRNFGLELKNRRLLGSVNFMLTVDRPLTLIGPSGLGKSSLIHWLCGTLAPAFKTQGTIYLDGQSIAKLPAERRRLGALFQDDLLFPHLTVGENLAFGIPSRYQKQARKKMIASALAEADLDGFEMRDPATLSGGQRARVALLRVLLSEPKALLLDEPFAKLDPALRTRFRAFVFRMARQRRLPLLQVSHDPEDAAAAAGEILDLSEFQTEWD